MYSDGDGLYLRVQSTTLPGNLSKSWLLRWGAQGKFTFALGSLRHIPLAQARIMAADCKKMIVQGIDPRAERQQRLQEQRRLKQVLTFEAAATMYIDTMRPSWKNEKHAQQWSNTLRTYAFPKLGQTACADITTEAVLSVLKPIWVAKNETATRLRGRIESVMDWAIASGHRSGENPAAWKGKLAHLLPAISKSDRVVHHAAMPYADIPEFIGQFQSNPSISAKALLFCILTVTRTNETIGAQWSEFDLKAGVWVIPKERMKLKREQRVPLAPEVIQLLKSIERSSDIDFVFSSREQNKPISNMAMLNFLKGTLQRTDLTVHGFRSTFRDWAAEVTSHRREVIEQSLAHSLADASEAAYQRGDYLDKRRLLMNDWATYCFKQRFSQPRRQVTVRATPP